MRWVPLGLFIASSFLFGCVVRVSLDEAPRKTLLSADHVELPATFVDQRPCVDLEVNGKGPYRFIVDTGSIGTNISERIAREAGVAVSKKIIARVSGASGKYENQPMAIVRRIESEGFLAEEVAVVVWPLGPAWGEGVDGIIGMATLGDVVLEIDYPKQKVIFSRPEKVSLPASDGIPYSGLRPQIAVSTPSAENPTIEAVIDTGAQEGFALKDIYCYPVPAGLSKEDRYTVDVGGDFSRPLYGQLLGDMSVGPALWRNPSVRESGENRISSHALEYWKLVIDRRKKMLWLVAEKGMMVSTKWEGPVESDGRPAVFGFASVSEGEVFLVKEVDSGGRAERAGLKVGDHYTWRLDDRGASEQKRGELNHSMRLYVRRGSESFEMVMSLSDPLPDSVR